MCSICHHSTPSSEECSGFFPRLQTVELFEAVSTLVTVRIRRVPSSPSGNITLAYWYSTVPLSAVPSNLTA
jgi:hypothetical protein